MLLMSKGMTMLKMKNVRNVAGNVKNVAGTVNYLSVAGNVDIKCCREH